MKNCKKSVRKIKKSNYLAIFYLKAYERMVNILEETASEVNMIILTAGVKITRILLSVIFSFIFSLFVIWLVVLWNVDQHAKQIKSVINFIPEFMIEEFSKEKQKEQFN